MKLIITRHGETEENVKGIMQGHLPGKLTEKGISQAKKLALRLKDEKIDYIYSSDLARASDTAKEISKFHEGVPIEFVGALRERDIGEFTGVNKSALNLSPEDYGVGNLHSKSGETIEGLAERAKSFLSMVLDKHKDGFVLFVAHNAINKSIIGAIMGKNVEEIKSLENAKNTSVSIFEIEALGKYQTILFNDCRHLEK